MSKAYQEYLARFGSQQQGQPQPVVKSYSDYMAEGPKLDEADFQSWYSRWAQVTGVSQNPDDPLQKYDYRAAFKAGVEPTLDPGDSLYHWPSRFKAADHPNRIVGGKDTRAIDMLGAARPEPEQTSLLGQAGRSAAQSLLQLPRGITKVAQKLHVPGAKEGVDYYDRYIAALESHIGPASTPQSEALARQHPFLNELYKTATGRSITGMGGQYTTGEGLEQYPGDVQAAAQTAGTLAGEAVKFTVQNKIAQVGAKGLLYAFTKLAPETASYVANTLSQGAGKISAMIGRGEETLLGNQVGGAVVTLPYQTMVAAGQMYIDDPDSILEPRTLVAIGAFGILGALGDGAVFGRGRERYLAERPADAPRGRPRGGEPPPETRDLPPGQYAQGPVQGVPTTRRLGTGDRPRGIPVILDPERGVFQPQPEIRQQVIPTGSSVVGSPSGPEPRMESPLEQNPLTRPLKDVNDYDLINSTVAEVNQIAERAVKERRITLNTILGKAVADSYVRDIRVSRSKKVSAERAAKALERIDRVRSRITPAEQQLLDDLDTRGYTAGRLTELARDIKSYDSQTLSQIPDPETLIEDFAAVLSSPTYDKNLSGLYRVSRLYAEMRERGYRPEDIVHPISLELVKKGVTVENAIKATINTLVKVTGSVDDLIQQRGGGAAARGKPGQLVDPLEASIVRKLAAGAGGFGKGYDPSLGDKLSRLYKGETLAVVVRELIQNSGDAIVKKAKALETVGMMERAGYRGKIVVRLNENQNQIVVEDNGTGMSPETLVTKFLDIGASGKEGDTDAAGKWGFAKAALLQNSSMIHVETVIETPEGPVLSVLRGSNEDYNNQTMQREVFPNDPSIPPGYTGTRISLTLDPVKAGSMNWGSAQEFVERQAHLSTPQTGMDVELTRNGVVPAVAHNRFKAVGDPHIVQLNSATLTFIKGVERPKGWDWIDVHVLNNGLFQFVDERRIEGRGLPGKLIVDVKALVDVEDPNYPFPPSRDALKGEVQNYVNTYLTKMATEGSEAEGAAFKAEMQLAVPIPDTRYTIVGHDISPDLLDVIKNRTYAADMTKHFDNLGRMVVEAIREFVPSLPVPRFTGLGIASDYLAVNIQTKLLNAKVRVVPHDDNMIMMNVHKHVDWAQRLLRELADEGTITNEQARDPLLIARVAGAQIWSSIVHEVVHQKVPGHREDFSTAISDYIGFTAHLSSAALPKLERLFIDAIKEGLLDDTARVSKQWKENFFKKFSGHREGDDLPGGSDLGAFGEEHVQAFERHLASGGKERRLSKGALESGEPLGPSTGGAASPVGAGDVPGGSDYPGVDAPDVVESVLSGAAKKLEFLGADPYEKKVTGNLTPIEKEFLENVHVGPRPENPEETWFTGLDRLYAEGVDRFHALDKFDKALGVTTPAERSTYVAARMAGGGAGRIYQELVNQPFVMVEGNIQFLPGKSYKKILRPLRGKLNKYRAAVIAEKAQELHDLGKKTEFDPIKTNLVMANLDPAIQQALTERKQFFHNVRTYGENSGLLDPEISVVLDFMGSAGVSWDRVFSRKETRKSLRKTAMNVGNVFQNKGDKIGLKMVDPITTDVDHVQRIMRTSDINNIGVQLVEAFEANPDVYKGLMDRVKAADRGDYGVPETDMESVKDAAAESGMDISDDMATQIAAIMSNTHLLLKGDRLIVRRNGKGEVWKIAPEIADAIQGLSPKAVHTAIKWLGFASQTAKAGITLDPTFAATQAFIATWHATMQSKNGFRPGIDSMIGLYHVMRNTPEYQKALAAGFAFGSLGAKEASPESYMRAVIPMTMTTRLRTKAMHPDEAFRAFLRPFNEMTQVGDYLRGIRAQKRTDLAAAYLARNVDTDFGVSGLKTQGLAHVTHFLNPYIQGTRTFAQTFTNPKKPNAWFLTGVAGIGLASAYFWLAAEDDEELRYYQNSPIGQFNWLVRIGDEIVKIRKPILWGQLFGNSVEFTLAKMKHDTPELFSQFMGGMVTQAWFQGMPALMQLYIGLKTNEDPMTGSPIRPIDTGQDVQKRYQLQGHETELARELGDKFNQSPAEIDFAIRQLTGTLGAQITRAGDWVMDDKEVSGPAPVKADWPLLGRFLVRHPSSAAEPIRTFYKRAEELAEIINTEAYLKKHRTGPEGEARYDAFREKYDEVIALAAPRYAKQRERIAHFRELMQEELNKPDFVNSREYKRKISDDLMREIIQLAKETNTDPELLRIYKDFKAVKGFNIRK